MQKSGFLVSKKFQNNNWQVSPPSVKLSTKIPKLRWGPGANVIDHF
jgi:hypothetical protein